MSIGKLAQQKSQPFFNYIIIYAQKIQYKSW